MFKFHIHFSANPQQIHSEQYRSAVVTLQKASESYLADLFEEPILSASYPTVYIVTLYLMHQDFHALRQLVETP